MRQVYFIPLLTAMGTRLVEAGRSRVRFPVLSLEFFIDVILPFSNRNEYKEYFLGSKSGRCVGLTTLPPSCADCLEIWEPQPPGTLRACPGLYWDCFSFTDSCTDDFDQIHYTVTIPELLHCKEVNLQLIRSSTIKSVGTVPLRRHI